MLYKEIINESLSRVAYHYTNVPSALKIVTSGKFELSSALGSHEESYAPKGYPYFLSATRTKHGGYHDYIGSNAVMFQLNGDWFNQHYKAGPIDYWLNRDPSQGHHRPHEAEDRIFSKDPSIPIDGVDKIYVYVNVYVKPEADPQIKAWARQLLINSKKRGIESYFYTDPRAWKNLDKRPNKQGDMSTLTGQEKTGGYVSTHEGYLFPWLQLIQTKEKDQLGKKANDIRYNLVYDRYVQDAISGLKNEFSNARKPNSGIDRQHAVKIIEFMRQNKIGSLNDLVKFIADKWKSKN